MKIQQAGSGNYFLHYSFLKEISEEWLTKGEPCDSALLLMKLAFNVRTNIQLFSCDRTMNKMETSKRMIGFVPGIYDLIGERALSNRDELDDELYAFEVASLKGIGTLPTFLITSNDEKEKIKNLANTKKYTAVKILCANDFDLSI